MPRGAKLSLTPAQDKQIAKLYRAGQTTYEIAAQFGVSPHPVTSALKRRGVPLRQSAPRSNWTGSDEQRAAIVAAYQSGESIRRMATRLRIRATFIIRALDEAGVNRRHAGDKPKFDDSATVRFAERYEAGATLTQIAEEFGATWPTIRKYLLQRGVQLREPGRPSFWTDEHQAEAVRRYQAGQSQQQIAEWAGCSQVSVSSMLRKLGVVTRGPVPRGEAHPSWKGGRVVQHGYVRVKLSPDDAHLIKPNSQGYVAEHRLVMARQLGRPLLPGENPHHKNTIRTDNDPGNLELWLSSQPSGGRVADLIEWSLALLDRYMPEVLVTDWQSKPRPEAVT